MNNRLTRALAKYLPGHKACDNPRGASDDDCSSAEGFRVENMFMHMKATATGEV